MGTLYYETEDPPLPNPIETEEHFENKEIEKVHLDLQGAKRRFGNCILDSGNADFSDSVATMRLKRGYKATELFEGDPIDEESFEDKYERICSEVEMLMTESEKRQAQPSQITKSEITALHDLLKSMASTTLEEKQLKTAISPSSSLKNSMDDDDQIDLLLFKVSEKLGELQQYSQELMSLKFKRKEARNMEKPAPNLSAELQSAIKQALGSNATLPPNAP